MAKTPPKKPLLNQRMKKARLNWAKNKENWVQSEWPRAIFSDESKFNLSLPDGCLKVRRRKGEQYSQNCCVSTVKHSPYVMIWGCTSEYKTESLIMLQGMVNAEKYMKKLFSVDLCLVLRPLHRENKSPYSRTIPHLVIGCAVKVVL